MKLGFRNNSIVKSPLTSLLVLLAPFCASSFAATPPNILFIYADDQPYKTVSCYPETPRWVKTPNIDRLAAEVTWERGACLRARACSPDGFNMASSQ